MENSTRPWIKQFVHTPAAREPGARGPRLRPLIWVYELPTDYSSLMLQYRVERWAVGWLPAMLRGVGHLIWAGLPCIALTARACPDMHGLQSRVSICKGRALSDLALTLVSDSFPPCPAPSW